MKLIKTRQFAAVAFAALAFSPLISSAQTTPNDRTRPDRVVTTTDDRMTDHHDYGWVGLLGLIGLAGLLPRKQTVDRVTAVRDDVRRP